MRKRYPLVLFVVFTTMILLGVLGSQGVQAGKAKLAAPGAVTSGRPISVNLSLATDPATLDPSLAGDTNSINVIEQLFVGLVTQDERSGEILPELATSWQVSADSMVYTFTLRSDATWSDGRTITAGDARYGILRCLDPAVNCQFAYVLFDAIVNAWAYNQGNVGAEQVGVDVLSDTSLRLRLEEPVGHFLSLMAMWHVRPLPRWAIESHGSDWTSPANIITSGPYTLQEYVSGDHLTLGKNWAFYNAAGVQIEKVTIWIVADGNQAWQMYLNDELDTVGVPIGTSVPPGMADQVAKQPQPCTYYYGFSQSQPPFNDPLVRKAFSAATNRQAVVDLLQGGQAPALTFTPRGLFGHVDGYAEGIGHPYNPTQAQQYLTDAGYPGGVGLPSITLWYSDGGGHQMIAEAIRDQWQSVLNVNVLLESRPWNEYLGLVGSGDLPVWRMGWCADYLDAYNFLGDAMANRNRHGGWSNATYDNLIDQSRTETDPETRKAMFKQAEEILVETDTMIIPIYFYGSHIASKPYLARTYPATSYHIAFWRMRTEMTIDSSGGSVSSYDGQTHLTIGSGVLSETAILTLAPFSGPPDDGEKRTVGRAFSITAVYSDTGEPVTPQAPYQMEFTYDDATRGPVIESSLALHYRDGGEWVKEASSAVDMVNDKVTAAPDHFSIWAVLGDSNELYIPVIRK